MAVAGHDTARVESRPEIIGDLLVGQVVTDDLLHLGQPEENLLVSQTVQRSGKAIETSGQRQEGRAQCGANQVSGVGRDVATLVVRVNGQVETEQLDEVGIVAESQLVGKVERVILVLLDRRNLAALEDVLVDASSNVGQLSNEVHGVLKSVTPVVLLIHTFSVSLGESRSVLESSDSQGKLSHGVKVGGAVINELLDELWDIRASSPLGRQVADLLLSRDFASQEKPEKT